jgi:hypothetical protein
MPASVAHSTTNHRALQSASKICDLLNEANNREMWDVAKL